MEEKHVIVQTYMRYSKRVVIFGMTSWVVIAGVVLGLLYWLSIGGYSIDEYVASVLRTVLSSSSGVAIASIGTYMAHSAGENWINAQKKLNQITNSGNNNEINNEGNG